MHAARASVQARTIGQSSMQQLQTGFKHLDIALVRIPLAKEPLGKVAQGFAVIDISWGQLDAQQLAQVMDHPMEFETKNQPVELLPRSAIP